MMNTNWLDEIKWTDDGLIPVIAQETGTGKVLMLAWMNRESLMLSVKEGRAIYWSRSRNKLWRKGEDSGHVQLIKDLRLDCDNDVLLLEVEQLGGSEYVEHIKGILTNPKGSISAKNAKKPVNYDVYLFKNRIF